MRLFLGVLIFEPKNKRISLICEHLWVALEAMFYVSIMTEFLRVCGKVEMVEKLRVGACLRMFVLCVCVFKFCEE
jgi:hypothetical protein